MHKINPNNLKTEQSQSHELEISVMDLCNNLLY